MAITALIPRREKCKSYQTAKSMVEKKKKVLIQLLWISN